MGKEVNKDSNTSEDAVSSTPRGISTKETRQDLAS